MQNIPFQKSSFIYWIRNSIVEIAFFSITLTIIIFVVNEYNIMYYVDICYLIIDNLTNSSLS